MPVIREQKQFSIGPIGIARVSAGVPSSNAMGDVANAVADAANNVADIFFRVGSQKAEKVGLEQGAAIEQQKILTIDPKTGEPVAYAPPQSFGTIAQEAYQRVVMSRFQTGIEQEIKLKAQELAVKYDGSVSRYSVAMSDYIGAMSEAAEGQFKTYITDVGTSYLNATRSAMAIDQIQRERKAAAESVAQSTQEGINFVEWTVANDGPNALADGPTMANHTKLSIQAGVNDAITAGLASPDASKATAQEIALAQARGLVRYVAKSGATSDELKMLNSAIGTGNAAFVPPQFSYIADAISGLGANYGALADLEKFSSGIFDDAITAQLTIEAKEVEAIKSARAVSTFQMTERIPDLVSYARDTAIKYTPNAVAISAQTDFSERNSVIQQMIAEGDTEGAKAQTEVRDSVLNGFVEGIGLQALKGLNPSETLQVELAINENNPALAPASAAEGVKAILTLAKIKPEVVDDFLSQVSSVRDGSAKFIAQQQEATAFAEVTGYAPDFLQGIQTSNAKDTEKKLSEFSSRLNSTPNLKPEDKVRFERRAYLASGISYLSGFFASSPTAEEIAQAEAYIATGTSTDALRPASRVLLDKVREYGTKSDNEAELRTQFSTLSSRAADMQVAAERDLAERTMLNNIRIGSANPSDDKAQALWDKKLSEQYGVNLSDALLDPTMPMSTRTIMTDILRVGVMPTSLKNVLASASTGSLNSAQTLTAISLWNNVRSKTDVNGSEILSPMVGGALTQDQIASLDMLSAFGSDPQKITDLLIAKAEYDTNPVFKDNLEKTLGTSERPKSLDDFILSLDGIEDAPRSAFSEMKAAALVYLSTRSATGIDVSTIQAKLERQLSQSYPDGGGIVYGQNNSSRTGAALSLTASGYEKDFMDYVLSDLKKYGVVDENGSSKFLFSESVGFKAGESGFRRYQNPIYLMPIGSAVGPDTKYRVMIWRSLDQGGSIPVLRSSNKAPFILSPNDPAFVTIKDNKRNKLVADETNRRETLGEFMRGFITGNLNVYTPY